jgi:hypothetical protein
MDDWVDHVTIRDNTPPDPDPDGYWLDRARRQTRRARDLRQRQAEARLNKGWHREPIGVDVPRCPTTWRYRLERVTATYTHANALDDHHDAHERA